MPNFCSHWPEQMLLGQHQMRKVPTINYLHFFTMVGCCRRDRSYVQFIRLDFIVHFLILSIKFSINHFLVLLLLFLSAISRLGTATAHNLHFCGMAFVLRSMPFLPATLFFRRENWAICLPHKEWGCPVKCLAQGHNKRTCGIVLHCLP